MDKLKHVPWLILSTIVLWLTIAWLSSNLFELEKLEGNRSPEWRKVRNAFIEKNPTCEACGSRDELNVHHVIPFHKNPDLELVESNLITLCREHHWTIGHDPDGPWGPKNPNWKASNPNVRQHAKQWRNH